jgi:hypothetical protein
VGAGISMTWAAKGNERLREDQKVRSARSLVNRFEENKSVDFHRARAINVAALNESRDLVDIARWWSVGREGRDALAHQRAHARQRC